MKIYLSEKSVIDSKSINIRILCERQMQDSSMIYICQAIIRVYAI